MKTILLALSFVVIVSGCDSLKQKQCFESVRESYCKCNGFSPCDCSDVINNKAFQDAIAECAAAK